jgi:valyl-tRNA synthetase
VNEHFEAYEMHDLCDTLRAFWLTDFCADYLEMSKPVLYSEDRPLAKLAVQNTMFLCLQSGLMMLHPVMPFVTEELFHRLPGYTAAMGSICVAEFPQFAKFKVFYSEPLDTSAALMRNVYSEARRIRVRLSLTKTRVDTYLVCADASAVALAESMQDSLATLAFAKTITVLGSDAKQPEQVLSTYISKDVTLLMNVSGLKELGAEVLRRQKQIAVLHRTLAPILVQQQNPTYVEKTKLEVQEKNAAKVTQYTAEIKEHEGMVTELMSVMDDAQKKLFYEASIGEAKRVSDKATKQLVKINKNLAKKPDNKKALKQKAESDAIVTEQAATIEKITALLSALSI